MRRCCRGRSGTGTYWPRLLPSWPSQVSHTVVAPCSPPSCPAPDPTRRVWSAPREGRADNDLRYEQVLRTWDGDWAVVDPLVVSGVLEFQMAPLLWSRFDEPGSSRVEWRIDALADAADLDRDRAGKWALLRAIEYWAWPDRPGDGFSGPVASSRSQGLVKRSASECC
ncbi:aminoglycoside phosphotransferase family protein [Streptomyces sp. TG1A-60]|uniref:aminoglycoside phosphotransferase family protein n=1 Tax=Streptomyces sp. TG1A-60 TaxID=3129111 RepID=UPI0030CC8855